MQDEKTIYPLYDFSNSKLFSTSKKTKARSNRIDRLIRYSYLRCDLLERKSRRHFAETSARHVRREAEKFSAGMKTKTCLRTTRSSRLKLKRTPCKAILPQKKKVGRLIEPVLLFERDNKSRNHLEPPGPRKCVDNDKREKNRSDVARSNLRPRPSHFPLLR